MIPKLFTRIDDPKGEWLTNHRLDQHVFYIPTEVVVKEPKIVTPKVGRFYEVDLYVREGIDGFSKLIPYEELREFNDFKGTSSEIQVYLYEVYNDCGDDGHTEYQLVCWMLHPGLYDGNPLDIHNNYYDVFHK